MTAYTTVAVTWNNTTMPPASCARCCSDGGKQVYRGCFNPRNHKEWGTDQTAQPCGRGKRRLRQCVCMSVCSCHPHIRNRSDCTVMWRRWEALQGRALCTCPYLSLPKRVLILTYTRPYPYLFLPICIQLHPYLSLPIYRVCTRPYLFACDILKYVGLARTIHLPVRMV